MPLNPKWIWSVSENFVQNKPLISLKSLVRPPSSLPCCCDSGIVGGGAGGDMASMPG